MFKMLILIILSKNPSRIQYKLWSKKRIPKKMEMKSVRNVKNLTPVVSKELQKKILMFSKEYKWMEITYSFLMNYTQDKYL